MRVQVGLAAASLLLALVPASAQQRGGMSGRASGQSGSTSPRHHFSSNTNRPALRQGKFASGRPLPTHVFSGSRAKHRDFHQGFGFSFGFPVFGLGFDAHHFSVLHRQQFATRPFVFPFFPVSSAVSSTVVVVVPQVVPVPVGVPVEVQQPVREAYLPTTPPAESLVGTPRAEERIEVVQPGLPGEPPPPPRYTLLVFKNHSIYAVLDYWLEGGQFHYLTSYGGRNTVPLEQIDLEMTVRLNWDRGIEFVLRPTPLTR